MPDALVTQLARSLNLPPDAARHTLNHLVSTLRQQLDAAGQAHVPGLGTFRRDDDGLAFEPDDALARAVNHRYAGLRSIEAGPSRRRELVDEDLLDELADPFAAVSTESDALTADEPTDEGPLSAEGAGEDAPTVAFQPLDDFVNDADDADEEAEPRDEPEALAEPDPTESSRLLDPFDTDAFDEAEQPDTPEPDEDLAQSLDPFDTAAFEEEEPDEPVREDSPADAAPTEEVPAAPPEDEADYDLDEVLVGEWADEPEPPREPEPGEVADAEMDWSAALEEDEEASDAARLDEGPDESTVETGAEVEDAPLAAPLAEAAVETEPDRPDDADALEEGAFDADAFGADAFGADEPQPEAFEDDPLAGNPIAGDPIAEEPAEDERADEEPAEDVTLIGAAPFADALREAEDAPALVSDGDLDAAVEPEPAVPAAEAPPPPVPVERPDRAAARERRSRPIVPLLLGAVVVIAAVVWFLTREPSAPVVAEQPPSADTSTVAALPPAVDTVDTPTDELAPVPDEPAPPAPEPADALRGAGDLDLSAGGFTWVVASEVSRAAAERRVARYREQGLRAGVVAQDAAGRTRYRVGLGQFGSLDEANARRSDLPADAPADSWILRL